MHYDLPFISGLLKQLKSHNVKYIKMSGLELEFHVEQSVRADMPAPEDSAEIIADTIKKQEEAMPPDLRADSLMDHDKVLNWSSPDQELEQPPMPLTGEAPL